jgi:hypothetical protein
VKRTPKTKIVQIEAQQLRIHPLAQRQLVPARLRALTADMDLDAVGVFHAVEYAIDGEHGIWIIDGQHRLRALLELGLGEWVVEVKIHTDVKDNATASSLFLKLNDRSPVSPVDKFENEVRAGFGPAVAIVELLRARRLKIGRAIGDGLVCCVTALKNLYAADGGKSLGLTLDMALGSWGHKAEAVEGKLLEGLGLLLKMHGENIDLAALAKKLAKYPGGPSGLLGNAKGLRLIRRAPLARCVAEVVAETYNANRTTGRLEVGR